MSSESWKLEKDLCRCCHSEGSFKNLAEPSALAEIYADMLRECFDIDMSPVPGLLCAVTYTICEVCVIRLRDATDFKKQVLMCEERFRNMYKRKVIRAATSPIVIDVKEELPDTDQDETGIANKIVNEDQTDDIFNDDDEINNSEPLKRKTIKRKITETKTSIRRKSTKQRQDEVDKKTRNYINPRQNVGLILEHSTILPFKSNKGYFNCFYCNKQFAGFDQLKNHVSELHKNISFKLILKSIRRPRDRIRADVSDLNCRICKKKIDNLEFLIQHLTEDHSVKFNFDSDTIKPVDCILAYDLSEGKYRCYQCKEEFNFFKTLTNHMNEHSTDYVCDVCGRCFLLADRLRAHSQSHKANSVVKCDLCGKICGSSTLLKSHIRYKHKKLSFMCSICDKSFNTSQKRVQHLEEVHKRAPLNLTCKKCLRKFENHKSLYSHMRSDHLNIKREPKYGCSVCGTMFTTNNGLSNHMVVHSGEKNYECEICHKKYGRRKTLMEHIRIHMNDKRFACGACSQAFVQKCSLKNHIRVHHGDMDHDKLIVDKKLDAK